MTEISYPKYRWFVLVAMSVTVLAQGIVMISPAPLVGVIAKMMGMSVGEATGGMMGLFTIIVALISITSGPLIDKLGMARVRILSVVLMLVGTVLMPVIGTSFGGLIGCRIIQAVGAGLTMGSLTLVASDWFPIKERALAVGLQGAGQAIGIIVGFAVIPGAFTKTGNLQWCLAQSTTILLMIAAILGLVVLFGPKPPAQVAVISGEVSVSTGQFKAALSMPVTWVAIIGGALMAWVYMAFIDLTPGYLAIDPPVGIGFGPVKAGQLMIGAQISFILGSTLCGVIIEKLFRGNEKPLLIISSIGSAIFIYAIKIPVIYANPSILLIDIILAGFFLGIPIPAALGFLAKYYPPRISGKIGGLGMGIIIMFGSSGVNLNAYFLHATGLYLMPIILVSVLSVASLIISLFLKPPKVFEISDNAQKVNI